MDGLAKPEMTEPCADFATASLPGESAGLAWGVSSDAEQRALRARAAIFLCGLSAFLDLYATQSVLREIADDFAVSAHRAGLTITATTLAVAAVAPLAGALADRVGRRRVIVAAALALAAPALLSAVATSFAVLLAWRFAEGFFIAAVFAATLGYIGEEWRGAELGTFTGIYVAGTIFGGFCGRFLAGVAAVWLGWRAGFLVLGGLNLAIGCAIAGLLPRGRQRIRVPSRKTRAFGLTRHFHEARLVASFAVGFCLLFAQVASFTYAGFHLAAPPFELNAAALGAIYGVFLLALLVSPLAGPWIARIGHGRAVSLALAVGAMGLLLALLPILPAIIFGLALSSTAIFVSQAAATSFIAAITAEGRSSAVGLYLTFYYIGGSVGAFAPAALWTRAGWPGCVALILATQALAIGLALTFMRGNEQKFSRDRQRAAAPDDLVISCPGGQEPVGR